MEILSIKNEINMNDYKLSKKILQYIIPLENGWSNWPYVPHKGTMLKNELLADFYNINTEYWFLFKEKINKRSFFIL